MITGGETTFTILPATTRQATTDRRRLPSVTAPITIRHGEHTGAMATRTAQIVGSRRARLTTLKPVHLHAARKRMAPKDRAALCMPRIREPARARSPERAKAYTASGVQVQSSAGRTTFGSKPEKGPQAAQASSGTVPAAAALQSTTDVATHMPVETAMFFERQATTGKNGAATTVGKTSSVRTGISCANRVKADRRAKPQGRSCVNPQTVQMQASDGH